MAFQENKKRAGFIPPFFCPDVSSTTNCDHGYGRPSGRPGLSAPATYHSGTPRDQHPAVTRLHAHLRGLVTVVDETSGLVIGATNAPTPPPVTLVRRKYLLIASFLLAKGPGVLKGRALSFCGLRGEWQYACSRAAGVSLNEAQLARPWAQIR
jgi:hypothetical protein